MAVATFNNAESKKVFTEMGVFSEEECDARQEVMYENYATTLTVEVTTMVQMIETAIIPACVKDLAKYKDFPKMAGERPELYENIMKSTETLKGLLAKSHFDTPAEEATYLCDDVKPCMAELRGLVDKAEGLIETTLYPYPTYEELLYSHHF